VPPPPAYSILNETDAKKSSPKCWYVDILEMERREMTFLGVTRLQVLCKHHYLIFLTPKTNSAAKFPIYQKLCPPCLWHTLHMDVALLLSQEVASTLLQIQLSYQPAGGVLWSASLCPTSNSYPEILTPKLMMVIERGPLGSG
jgi:hypothetical protein